MKSFRSKLILGSLVAGLGIFNSTLANAAFEGFGSDIPLESAAKQIVPEGYSVDFAPGVDRSTSISWAASSDWQGALSSAVAKKGLRAEIGSGTVLIVKAQNNAESTRPYSSTPSSDMVQKKKTTERKSTPRPQKVEPKAPPREEASIGGGGFVIKPYRDAASAGNATSNKEVLSDKDIVAQKDGWNKYDAKGKFIVEEGYMLHGTLNTWAEATGWKVVWNSQHDYLIEASATFEGDFVKASSDLVHAMRDARPQITVDYYQGNKVIVISNKLSDEVNR